MADEENLDVVVICGSLRKGSYNAALARTLPKLAPPAMKLRTAPPFDTMPFYNFDIQNTAGFPAEATAFADAIRAADGVIIVSPEYNWSIPGTLKNAIDWVSRMQDQPFEDKPVALQSAARGRHGRRAHAVSPAAKPAFTRRDPVRPPGNHRDVRAEEIQREDSRAD
jgi:chromate reductase, NAD(P)H dehydrogenase (quinone)